MTEVAVRRVWSAGDSRAVVVDADGRHHIGEVETAKTPTTQARCPGTGRVSHRPVFGIFFPAIWHYLGNRGRECQEGKH